MFHGFALFAILSLSVGVTESYEFVLILNGTSVAVHRGQASSSSLSRSKPKLSHSRRGGRVVTARSWSLSLYISHTFLCCSGFQSLTPSYAGVRFGSCRRPFARTEQPKSLTHSIAPYQLTRSQPPIPPVCTRLSRSPEHRAEGQ